MHQSLDDANVFYSGQSEEDREEARKEYQKEQYEEYDTREIPRSHELTDEEWGEQEKRNLF